jgi:hypothetical protein
MRYIIGGEIDVLSLASHDSLHWLLCHAIIIMIYINNINVEKNSICFTLKKKKKKYVCIEKIVHDSTTRKKCTQGCARAGVDKPELVLVSSLNSHHLRRT